MPRQHIPETDDDITIKQWLDIHTRKEIPMYQPRIERRQRIAIIVLAALLLIVGSLAAYKASAQTINRQAVLAWIAPTTCQGGGAISNCPILGYSVQKLQGTTWVEIGTTTASVTTYTDRNLPLGTHTYRVLATSEAGPSNPSNQAAKTIDVPGAPGNVAITVTVVVTTAP